MIRPGEATLNWPEDFTLDDGIYSPETTKPFPYCDGEERESRMLRELLDVTDRSTLSRELRAMAVDWPSRYHFSPRRSNLLRPIQLRSGARVLEVGCGCGALTRYLGESNLDVLALEGNAQRARISAARTADLENVTVVAADFNDVRFAQKFDHVVLVGVLEYAAEFDDGPTPHESLLNRCRQLLSPAGSLILAIENRFGLKYFAGIAEDHTGHPYMGVNGGYVNGGPKTFTYCELQDMLQGAGFTATRTLTPSPDYKLVRNVVDFGQVPEGARETVAQMTASSTYEDLQIIAPPAFSIERALSTAARDGLGLPLGNSFLFLAGTSAADIDSLTIPGEFAWHYALERAPGTTKATVLVARADGLYSRQANLDTGQGPRARSLTQTCVDGPLLKGKSVWLQLLSIVNTSGWDCAEVARALTPWMKSLCGTWQTRTQASWGEAPIGDLFDATPYNAFSAPDGVVTFFDLEWSLDEDVPLGLIVLRGILFSLDMLGSCEAPTQGSPELLGDFAKEIANTLLHSQEIPYQLPSGDSFLQWLAAVQSAASGMPVSGSRHWLEKLWTKPLPVRIRPARVAMLEM